MFQCKSTRKQGHPGCSCQVHGNLFLFLLGIVVTIVVVNLSVMAFLVIRELSPGMNSKLLQNQTSANHEVPQARRIVKGKVSLASFHVDSSNGAEDNDKSSQHHHQRPSDEDDSFVKTSSSDAEIVDKDSTGQNTFNTPRLGKRQKKGQKKTKEQNKGQKRNKKGRKSSPSNVDITTSPVYDDKKPSHIRHRQSHSTQDRQRRHMHGEREIMSEAELRSYFNSLAFEEVS